MGRADGFYKRLPIADYLSEDALSKSGLTDLWLSPMHYKARREEPKTFDGADIGTAVHALVLEPERAEKILISPPAEVLGKNGSKNTNAYREWIGSQDPGVVILNKEDREAAYFMADAINSHPAAQELLQDGNPEVSMFWTDAAGIRRKARPDWLSGVYVDLKTARSAKPEVFGKHAYDLHYHWSAAWTIDIGNNLGAGINEYFFIVVEKEHPYPVTVFETPRELIEMARAEIAPLYETYRACLDYNTWPGYAEEIQTLKFPRWAYKKQEEE